MAELSFTTDIRREPAAWSRVEQKCQQLLSENYLTEVEFEELKTVIRERWDSIERFVLGEMVSDDLNAFVEELRNDPFLRLVCIYFRGSLDVWQRPIHPDDWELYSKAWDVINTYPDVGESSSLADLGGIYSPSSINSSIRFRRLEEAKTALKQLVLNQRLADIGLHNLEVAENEQRGGSRRFHSRSILRDFYLGIHKYIRSENLEFLLKQFDRLKSGELQLDYDFRLGLVARLYEGWPIERRGYLSFFEDDITKFGKPKFRGLINKVISSDPKLVDYLTQVAFGIRETASWKNGDFVRATAVMIMVNRWIDEDDRQMLVEWANYLTGTLSRRVDPLYRALWKITLVAARRSEYLAAVLGEKVIGQIQPYLSGEKRIFRFDIPYNEESNTFFRVKSLTLDYFFILQSSDFAKKAAQDLKNYVERTFLTPVDSSNGETIAEEVTFADTEDMISRLSLTFELTVQVLEPQASWALAKRLLSLDQSEFKECLTQYTRQQIRVLKRDLGEELLKTITDFLESILNNPHYSDTGDEDASDFAAGLRILGFLNKRRSVLEYSRRFIRFLREHGLVHHDHSLASNLLDFIIELERMPYERHEGLRNELLSLLISEGKYAWEAFETTIKEMYRSDSPNAIKQPLDHFPVDYNRLMRDLMSRQNFSSPSEFELVTRIFFTDQGLIREWLEKALKSLEKSMAEADTSLISAIASGIYSVSNRVQRAGQLIHGETVEDIRVLFYAYEELLDRLITFVFFPNALESFSKLPDEDFSSARQECLFMLLALYRQSLLPETLRGRLHDIASNGTTRSRDWAQSKLVYELREFMRNQAV